MLRDSRSPPRERHTSRVDCEGEVGNIPDGGDRSFTPYLSGGTASVYCEGELTKLGYLTFDPGGMSKINWSSTGGSGSENIK